MSEATREIGGRKVKVKAPDQETADLSLTYLSDALSEARAMNRRGESWSENLRDLANDIEKDAHRAGQEVRFTIL